MSEAMGEQSVEQIQRERDLEWVDAIMPGNRRSLIGRTYNTPEKYIELAAAQSELEAEDREETQMLRLRLRSKRQEVADQRSRIRELLVTADQLREQLTAALARAEKAEGVLKQIGRMKLFPDDKTNRFTLHAAKQLATNYFGVTPSSDAEGR